MFHLTFFIISNSENVIKVGHFTGDIINGSKVLTEIVIKSNGKWCLFAMGKTVHLEKLGVEDKFTDCDCVFETVRRLKYCKLRYS